MSDAARGAVPVGVVGVGAMGRNHARVLSEIPEANLIGIYDDDSARAAEVAGEFGIRSVASLEELAADCEALVLAIPTAAHADIGCALLAEGKHLLIEKPLAPDLEQADRLLQAARGRVLAVGHVEFHNPAVEALIAAAPAARFLEVERLSVFSPRSLDVDVVLDLMIHDLQILHALDPSAVTEIRATGIAVLSPRTDIASVRIELASGAVANLTASRISAERVRKIRVFLPEEKRYYSLDYRAQEVKGFRLAQEPTGLTILPDDLAVVQEEPLKKELAAFLRACRGESVRYVDGTEARRALETALQVVAAIDGNTASAGHA